MLNHLSVRMQEKYAEISFKREIAGESATFLDLVDLVSPAARFSENKWAQQLFRTQGVEAGSMEKFGKLETRKSTAKTFAVAQIHLRRVRALQLQAALSVKLSTGFGNVKNLLTNLCLHVSIFSCRTFCASIVLSRVTGR